MENSGEGTGSSVTDPGLGSHVTKAAAEASISRRFCKWHTEGAFGKHLFAEDMGVGQDEEYHRH